MRGPQFDEFAEDLWELDPDLQVYATGDTADALHELRVPVRPATDLLEQAGIDPTDLKRPVVAGVIGGLIAAGETQLDMIVTGTRPPTDDPAKIDFGSPTYELAGYKAGLAVVTGPHMYRPVMHWLRAGRANDPQFADLIRTEVHQAAIDFHQQAWRHVRRRLGMVVLGDKAAD